MTDFDYTVVDFERHSSHRASLYQRQNQAHDHLDVDCGMSLYCPPHLGHLIDQPNKSLHCC